MLPNVRDVPWVCSSALLSAIHPSRTQIADVFHIFPPHFRPRTAEKGNVKQSTSQRHTAPHHGRAPMVSAHADAYRTRSIRSAAFRIISIDVSTQIDCLPAMHGQINHQSTRVPTTLPWCTPQPRRCNPRRRAQAQHAQHAQQLLGRRPRVSPRPTAPESKSREGDLLGGHDVNRSSNDLRILFLELF